MQYISTRGETPASNFDDVLLSGLAPDGGLFVPENWPQLSAEEVAAFAAQVGLVALGPYEVSLVVTGADRVSNVSPPTLVLAMQCVWMSSVFVVALPGAGRRKTPRPRRSSQPRWT